jgi:hypothetical protein
MKSKRTRSLKMMIGRLTQFVKVDARVCACVHTCAVPPPHVPELSADDDTRHFEDVEEAQPNPAENLQPPKAFAGNQLPFIGFTYSKEFR